MRCLIFLAAIAANLQWTISTQAQVASLSVQMQTCNDTGIFVNHSLTVDKVLTLHKKNGKVYVDSINFSGNAYYVYFGYQQTAKHLTTECTDITSKSIFGNFVDGKKSGIWLKWYFWGALRKASRYKNGKLLGSVYFRINGTMSKFGQYPQGSRRKPHWIHFNKEEIYNQGTF